MCGSKDLIVKILANKLFAFLARLSFCGYLIHFVVIQYALWSSQDALYMNVENLIVLYLSELTFTLLSAFVLHLFVEQPIINLAAIIFATSKKQANMPTLMPLL